MEIAPDVLQLLHENELEIMDCIHALCEENSITYYMGGGSALGAKRHGGFIPWDDDIDIALPRQDYERFIRICSEGHLPPQLFLHHSSTDPLYTADFAKIRKNNTHFPEAGNLAGTKHTGIFVDVFPLDYTRTPKSLLHRLRGELIVLSKKLILRKRTATKPQNIIGRLIYWLAKPISLGSIITVRDWLMTFHSSGDYFTCYGGVYGYQRDTYPTRIFGKPVPATFEDRIYLLPEHCEEYLERLYGDWRQLPPPEARRWHCTGEIIFDTSRKDKDTGSGHNTATLI